MATQENNATTPTEQPVVNGGDVTAEELDNKEKKHDKAACADLEKITDFEEDKEISNQNIGDAITLLEGKRSVENNKKAAREKELSQVKIRKDDVETIIKELEVTQGIAERTLRETGGDVVKALIILTN